MESLPPELLLHILKYLTARDIVGLRGTSKRLRALGRDNDLWKSICFENAALDPNFLRPFQEVRDVQDDSSESQFLAMYQDMSWQRANADTVSQASRESGTIVANGERGRSIANWDPSYPTERIDWYQEYVARHAPLSMNWLQTPFTRGQGIQTVPESKGLGLFSKAHDLKVVSPLDDGSICIWDISHHGREPALRGSSYVRSEPGLLSVDGKLPEGPRSRAKATSTGVVECVSVDSFREKAYIAVQSGLNEVDLSTLQVSSHQRYPFSIAALSHTGSSTPLTVGTTLTLHLHDHRLADNIRGVENVKVDNVAKFPASPRRITDFQRLLSGDVDTRSAHLFQPGPLSIAHLYPGGVPNAQEGEIYVAGRFPSILMYDRRSFPRIRATLYSGASLCSMTSLPFSFKLLETDLMRYNQLSLRQVAAVKATPGDRLVACGEYHGKGSLEIYGLEAGRSELSVRESTQPSHGQNASFKNRVSAARSKLLSVVTHGTRILVSDSDGNLRWMERNGTTLVRSWNLNQYLKIDNPLFGRSFAPNTGDVARKLLPTNAHENNGGLERDEILVWTGERIGLVGFTKRSRFGADPDDIWADQLVDQMPHEHEMRRTLERQADEMQWMKRFGFQDAPS